MIHDPNNPDCNCGCVEGHDYRLHNSVRVKNEELYNKWLIEHEANNLADEDRELYQLCRELRAKGLQVSIQDIYDCQGRIEDHPLLDGIKYDDGNKVVATFYKRSLAGAFAVAVEQHLAAPISDQLSLFQELAIIREIANPAISELAQRTSQIEQIEKILARQDLNDNDHKILTEQLSQYKELYELASQKAIHCLKHVSEFCEKAAKIDALSRDKFSIHTIHSVVAQLTRLCADKLHSHNLDHLAVEIEEDVRTKLIVPVSGGDANLYGEKVSGTDLTPDQQLNKLVMEMDSMIPDQPLNETDSE